MLYTVNVDILKKCCSRLNLLLKQDLDLPTLIFSLLTKSRFIQRAREISWSKSNRTPSQPQGINHDLLIQTCYPPNIWHVAGIEVVSESKWETLGWASGRGTSLFLSSCLYCQGKQLYNHHEEIRKKTEVSMPRKAKIERLLICDNIIEPLQ